MKRRIFLPVILLVILLSVPFMARAGSENDQSWMRPIPPEPAVYASIPEFKGAPMPPHHFNRGNGQRDPLHC